MEEMKNKVVLITGASTGIGEGLAYAFARKGGSLSLCGRNVENLKKVEEKCVSEGAAKTIQVVADVTKVDDMERMVDETVAKLGQVDVLINNAGYGCKGGIENGTLEEFDEVFSVNLKAPYYLMQRCLPHLKKTKGCVINLSSCYANMFVPEAVHYSMTKVGLDHLTKCAAIELGKYGIRVNNVNPGLVVTEMV
ncbi:putative galactose dehydrogenase GalD [Ciona intestinalis]